MDKRILDIMSILDEIEYGFRDEVGNNIIDSDPEKWDMEFPSFYYLLSPDELLKLKCGVCWDQVELERKLFSDINVDFKTYFMFIMDDDKLPSHTFLTFEVNGKNYWFEHSWGEYKGIHEYNNEIDLLNDVSNIFRKHHSDLGTELDLYIYHYEKPPYHITCDEFYEFIETQKCVDLD